MQFVRDQLSTSLKQTDPFHQYWSLSLVHPLPWILLLLYHSSSSLVLAAILQPLLLSIIQGLRLNRLGVPHLINRTLRGQLSGNQFSYQDFLFILFCFSIPEWPGSKEVRNKNIYNKLKLSKKEQDDIQGLSFEEIFVWVLNKKWQYLCWNCLCTFKSFELLRIRFITKFNLSDTIDIG